MEKDFLLDSSKGSFIFSSFYKMILFISLIIFAFYLARVFFGVRSVEVLLDLNSQEKELSALIKEKKNENAKLQKKLLEYKVLIPE
ncbi:MAG TPA: hypothetical protein EYG69_05470 [Campylobacterales bacterium]|nr:hypothetical protein [Campylobacterales bacterium]